MNIFDWRKKPAEGVNVELKIVDVKSFSKLVQRLKHSDVYGFSGAHGVERLARMCGMDVDVFKTTFGV